MLTINLTPGLPPPLAGACIFLMWDGTLCEGQIIRREDGRLVLVHYDLTAPHDPQRIEHSVDEGGKDKVQGYVRIADRGRSAAFALRAG